LHMSPCYTEETTCNLQGCSRAHDQNRCKKKQTGLDPKLLSIYTLRTCCNYSGCPTFQHTQHPRMEHQQHCNAAATQLLNRMPSQHSCKNDAAAVATAQACKHCQHHNTDSGHLQQTHTLSCVVAAQCSPTITLHTAGSTSKARPRAAQNSAAGGDQWKAATESTRW